jgi:hypothetical protein
MEPGRGRLMILFDGEVTWRRGTGAVNFWLYGRTRADAAAPASEAEVLFSGATPLDLPAVLHDVQVTELNSQGQALRCFRIESTELQTQLQARSMQAHRSAAAELFGAVPPAIVPWRVRVGWRLLLSLLRLPAVGALVLGRRGTS